MKATTVALFSLFAAANAESHAAAPIPVDAGSSVSSRRLGINTDEIRDAIADAIADLRDAKDLDFSALLDFELNFDFSPSEFLADKAREALDNFEEPPPKNFRERLRRAARDAAIEGAISALERSGKKQEDLVKDFLKDVTDEVKDFAKVEIAEWMDFIKENVQDVEEFLDSPAVKELLEDPLKVITEEYWDEHGDALREVLDNIEAEEFVLQQIKDAKAFMQWIGENTREIVDESFGFLTETIETLLNLAERFGIEHNALDVLEEFIEDPLEFFKKAFKKLIEEKASESANILPTSDRRRAYGNWCLKTGRSCTVWTCDYCCEGFDPSPSDLPSVVVHNGQITYTPYGVCA